MIHKSALQLNIFCWLVVVIIGAKNIIEDHSEDVIGKDCKITEPIYGTQFDFNPLNSLGHKIKGEGNYSLEFNLCGKLPNQCNNSDASANLFWNGSQICFDDSKAHEPIHSNGRLSFNLTGGICNKSKRYRLIVVMICDYSSQVQEPLNLLPYNDTCEFIVMYRTPAACHPLSAPINSNTCTAKDATTNHIFNLLPLSYWYNSEAIFKNGMKFIINVCKPVFYGYSEMCPPNSSICLVNTTETDVKKRFINYGTTVPDPIFENNELLMRFKSNQTCPTDGNKTISSIITFLCDEKAVSKGEPEFLAVSDCEYKFTWITAYACNKIAPCVVNDPINGFKYDLSELSKKKYELTFGNKTYEFGICKSPDGLCVENVGACLKNTVQSSSMGVINDILRLSEKGGAPYFLYESGSACDQQHKWSTKIEFICENDPTKGGPKFIEDTNCTVIIQFLTKLVCQKEISCRVYDYNEEREIDLKSLRSSINYEARIDEQLQSKEPKDVKYYLNVCRPLEPQHGLNCKGNSAACRAIDNGTKNPDKEQSLGYADASLTVVNTGNGSRPQLKYLKGDICPHDPQTLLSSQIEFYCDPSAGRGTPILKEIQNDCHYQFEWATNVICRTHIGQFREETCEIVNSQLNSTFDLRNLFKDGIIEANYDNKPIKLNACKNNSRIEINYAQNTVNSFFDATASCGKHETINVEMRLVCSTIESHSFTSGSSCSLVYVMETPQICPQLAIVLEKADVKVTVVNKNGNDTSASSGLSTLGIILITLTLVATIMAVILFVLRRPERRIPILSFWRKGNGTVLYSRENLFDN